MLEQKDDSSSKNYTQVVFSSKDSEIKKTAITQCVKHSWEKLSENELYCPICQSGALINPEDMKKYVIE